MPPNKEANSFASPPAGLICLPPISEELQLVWTQAAQTSELDGNEHLLRTFSYFPYPSLADIALLCLRYGLQMEKVKTWFMAQRLRCGISWSSEEIEETRARVVYNRDQLHFKSLLSLTHHAGRPPEDVSPTPVPPSDSDGTHISPLALNESPQVKRLKMEPEESSSLSLSHHKAKEPLVAPGNGAFPHQPPGFWQELQSGLSKELVSRGSDHQPHGLGTAAWDHSTSFHLPHTRDRPSPITLLANSCKQEPASILPPSSSTSSSSFRVMANGATATSKPLQSLGCVPQPPSPNEQALPPHLEPAWPQGLRHSPGPGRVAPAEYYFPDMQRQRKTKRKTKEQLAILKSFFLQCQWARREDYCKLEQITGLPRPEIIQWFGDTRYALKHGQLKWFRDNAVPGPPSYQEPATPTPQPVARPLQEWAEMPPPPLPPPPPDTSPLERYWTVHQQLREEDLPRLSLESGLSTQQVVDWFYSRSPEPAEVVVCLDEEDEEEEEEDLPEEDGGEEEEEEEEEEDEVIIQD